MSNTADTSVETNDDGLVVEITGGRIRGFHQGPLRTWRGIPYAAPPIGERRFRAPGQVTPWQGIRDAVDYGPIAPQPVRRRAQFGPALTPVDEDCLTVNVQAPAPADELLPVMVFIHGGGYSAGSSRDFSGQGESFVLTGRVLYISFNYRLGALGYLDFTGYSTPERPIDSNLGLRDQLALLEWVQRNIAAFGGDPHNVTIFGESAGGGSVTTLLGMPRAAGLFARAIAQSAPPSSVYPVALTREWAAEFVEIVQRRVSLKPQDPAGSSLAASVAAGPPATGALVADPAALLVGAEVADLVAACTELQRESPDAHPATFCLSPTIDGDLLPEHPMLAIREGHVRPVPLIIGTNAREGAVFRGPLDVLPTTAPRIGAMFARATGTGKRLMHAAYPGLPKRRESRDFGGDYGFWYPSTVLADASSRHAPTHAYRFDFATRLLRLVGLDATHGVEMFALYDRFDLPLVRAMTTLGGREAYAGAGERMRRAWLSFATDSSLPDSWPAYDESARSTLIIDERDSVEQDPRRERRLAWEEFLPLWKILERWSLPA